ncbi:MAG: hypothetical protein L0Z55_09990 [Planctomycetes bacterium]|nr:hypothetical protein [Planctomycetota bacterium]
MEPSHWIVIAVASACGIFVSLALLARELRWAENASLRANRERRARLAEGIASGLRARTQGAAATGARMERAAALMNAPAAAGAPAPKRAGNKLAEAPAPAIMDEIGDRARQDPQALAAAIRNMIAE